MNTTPEPASEPLRNEDGLVITLDTFSEEIEKRILSGIEEYYIEAVANYIEELDEDAVDMKHLISPTLIGKNGAEEADQRRMGAEALKRGMFKERSTSLDLTSLFK